MIILVRQAKTIAIFFTAILCLQSCMVYQKTTVTAASQQENKKLKIKTSDGTTFKTYWLTTSDSDIQTFIKSRRVFIDKNDLDRIMVKNPDWLIVPLDLALEFDGPIYMTTKTFREYHPYETYAYNHQFDFIEETDEAIIGYKLHKKHQSKTTVPLNEIEKIKEISVGGSIALNSLGLLGLSMMVLSIHATNQFGRAWSGGI